jgi:SpoVK/Ycf46/Vps4 family AAA+-type ATPase
LSLYKGGERFADLGGLEALKSFCLRALQSKSRSVKPRGLLLLGIPGSGKSALCKALGNETGRPTIILDVGKLMGSLVGQSESQTRQALRTIDAMGPSITMVDEVEKALSGVASSGNTDSGVSARMFGTLLSWLSDRESDSFVVCTANDVSRLPPEFSRAERFDALFFLDLPGREQKDQIWELYAKQFGIVGKQRRPNDDQWTGAEIRSCCRLAALLGVPLAEAAQNVVPVAVTAAESVERLRAWASGRCLSADVPGLFRPTSAPGARRGRRVSRDPSDN